MNPPPLSQSCARISAELLALESERWRERLADPEYRAFLVALYRLALTDDNDFTVSARGGTSFSEFGYVAGGKFDRNLFV